VATLFCDNVFGLSFHSFRVLPANHSYREVTLLCGTWLKLDNKVIRPGLGTADGLALNAHGDSNRNAYQQHQYN